MAGWGKSECNVQHVTLKVTKRCVCVHVRVHVLNYMLKTRVLSFRPMLLYSKKFSKVGRSGNERWQ